MIMPRPLGKYFSATIAKFRSFKEQEHIEVDENLRLQLRNNLFIKAGAVKKPSRSSFGERFLQWKQYIPILPSLFLLAAAAFAFNKLPVTFESGTIVPKISPENKQEKPLLPSVQPVPIKTQEAPNEFPENVLSEERVSEETQKARQINGKKPITRGKESPEEINKDTFSTNRPSRSEANTAPRPLGASLLPDKTETRNNEERKPLPMPFVFTGEPEPKRDTQSLLPSKPSTETKQPEIPLSPTLESSPNERSANWEPPKIYFQGNFSRDERTLLKNDFIPGLIDGKNVLYVNVHEGPNEGFAVVEIYLEDGDVDTHVYNLHERTPH
mgnify:FL=1